MATNTLTQAMWEAVPLSRFSVYSQLQFEATQRLAEELRTVLDKSIEADVIDGSGFQSIYGLFWLWVVATYEIARTMSQHGECFVPELAAQVSAYKRRVAQLRIPFTKQEMRGTGKPIGAEASVYGIDPATKDLSFKVGHEEFWVRALLHDFESLIQGIAPAHVLKDIREVQLET